MERSLILIKPDAVQRCIAGEIIARLEKRGLKIVAMKMLRMDKALAERHYAIHREKPFFNDLVKFITSGPIIAAVFDGENAVESIRQMMGATDPKKAAPGTIRADLGLNMEHNMIHGSDSVENAEKEISIFFKPEEVLTYTREIDRWVTGS
ncbi:MAG: nucleoside-diphosphate kinase [Chloroflexi bacterium]|nr:nucleoside-diphosphate kinase [Chloroflexota bacterium]